MNKRNIFFPDISCPGQIICALCLIYLSLAIGFVAYFINIATYILAFKQQVSLGTILIDLTVSILFLLVSLFFTIKIAAGRNWARILFFLVTIGTILVGIFNINLYLSGDPILGIYYLSEVILYTLASALLLQPSSSAWFKSGKGGVPTSNDGEEDLSSDLI